MLLKLYVATKRIAHKICQSQPPAFGSYCSRFHPNLFTFGRVTAERAKAVLLPHRVFSGYALRASVIFMNEN